MNINTTRRGAPFVRLMIGFISGSLMVAAMLHNATASPRDDAPSIVVRFDARALATDAGARQIVRRLESAARRVCPEASNQDLAGQAAASQCREAAVDRAIQQIDNAHLAQIRTARTRRG